MRETKQVIVMRNDLNMRKGKMIAQGSHASLGVILRSGYVQPSEHSPNDGYYIPMDDELESWIVGRFKKVCLRVDSEQELLDLHQKAQDAGLRTVLITDAGLTEFNGVPTNTCIAIGPHYPEKIDVITGHLKLL